MILANYGFGSSKHKDPNSAKVLSKSLQIRTRAELALKQHLKAYHKINDNKRSDILNSIADYYSRIPFNVVIWNKYQVKQCIVDSILLLDSRFNPFRAKEAFESVEKMLVNLIKLPWHREFRKIHTYSGQFRRTISESLIGIEEVFKAAGFEYAQNSVIQLVLPENKMPQVDGDESVTSVIFDCMLAQVILNNIIEIYHKCNSTSKFSDIKTKEVNHYCWIQAYFRERSNHTTDKACSNIAELLNNITNLITRLNKSSSTSLNSNSNPQCDRQIERRGSIECASGTRSSPKSILQDKTRESPAQQSNDEDNLLALPSDLLRIPSTSQNSDNLTVYNNKRLIAYSDHMGTSVPVPSVNKSINPALPPKPCQQYQDNFAPSSSIPTNHHSYNQSRSIFDRLSTSNSTIAKQSSAMIDQHDENLNDNYRQYNYNQQNSMHRRENINIREQNDRVDSLNNDREPLFRKKDDRALILQKSNNRYRDFMN